MLQLFGISALIVYQLEAIVLSQESRDQDYLSPS